MAFMGPSHSLVRRSGSVTLPRLIPHLTGALHGGEEIAYVDTPGFAEFIEIVPGSALRQHVADSLRVPEAADLGEIDQVSDPALLYTAIRIRASALGGLSMNDVEAEELVTLTLATLIKTHLGGRSDRSRSYQLALDDRRKARVFDYIEAHLGEPLSLDRLADVAALSKYHFIRAFKATVGATPGRYVQSRKIEAGRRALLSARSQEVARRETGLSSASHFNDLFQRDLGCTPGRYLMS